MTPVDAVFMSESVTHEDLGCGVRKLMSLPGIMRVLTSRVVSPGSKLMSSEM